MTKYLQKKPNNFDGNTSLRMFCFHHAGAGTSLYHGWQNELGNQVEVLPVLLPGRESRINETRFQSMDALVEDMAHQLAPYLEVPHVFFGHSMGALVAYKLACYRYAKDCLLPRILFISSCAAPQLKSVGSALAELDDRALLELVGNISGLPQELLSHPELIAYMLPILRDDLAICSGYQHKKMPIALPCPFHLFGGASDTLASEEQLRGWSHLSSERCGLNIFPGGHFYLRDAPDILHAELRVLLRQHSKILEHEQNVHFSQELLSA